MLPRLITLTIVATLTWAGLALAQSDDPAELPSPNYSGQSYIDSNGCIFLRAGYGDIISWVPRVDQNRNPICGQTPTNDIANVASAAAIDKPLAPAARTRTKTVHSVSPQKRVMIGCPVSVPIARRYATTDGGSVVICTRQDGSLTGARSPIYPNGSGVGVALSQRHFPGVTIPLPSGQIAALPEADVLTSPPGYERAWKDDRFNPLRGKGTAQRQAAQDKLLTRAVPAVAVVAPSKPIPKSTSSTNATMAGAYFVQVGAFGEPGNADGASARLKTLGLPVSRGKFIRHGKALQVIYAGPFASGSDAQAALGLARGSGFSDAFLR